MKKSFIIVCLFVLVLIAYAVITSNWHHVYYISGSLGCMGVIMAIFTYVDKLILGNKGTLFSKEVKKEKRTENIKKYLAASSVNLIVAFIGFLFM